MLDLHKVITDICLTGLHVYQNMSKLDFSFCLLYLVFFPSKFPYAVYVSQQTRLAFEQLAHGLTWLKTQCSTVHRWLSVARYICFASFSFFFFVFTDWQHSGVASMCHYKLVSLSKLLSCLLLLCRFSPLLAQLLGGKQKNRNLKQM